MFAKLDRLHIEPSGLARDEEFLRRVYLDTIGLLPTQKEAEEFLSSKDPAKRAKLIDHLLERPEFSEVWALKFTELFRAGTREAGPKAARFIYEYVKRSFVENKPYSKMLTELARVRASLGGARGGDLHPVDRAAEAVLAVLGTAKTSKIR